MERRTHTLALCCMIEASVEGCAEKNNAVQFNFKTKYPILKRGIAGEDLLTVDGVTVQKVTDLIAT